LTKEQTDYYYAYYYDYYVKAGLDSATAIQAALAAMAAAGIPYPLPAQNGPKGDTEARSEKTTEPDIDPATVSSTGALEESTKEADAAETSDKPPSDEREASIQGDIKKDPDH
jgi:hypothetical protein